MRKLAIVSLVSASLINPVHADEIKPRQAFIGLDDVLIGLAAYGIFSAGRLYQQWKAKRRAEEQLRKHCEVTGFTEITCNSTMIDAEQGTKCELVSGDKVRCTVPRKIINAIQD